MGTPYESQEIAARLRRLDHIDETYVQRVSDEIYTYQPFMISMFLGYRLDVDDAELEEIMKLFFLIWECFKDGNNIRTIQVTEESYTKAHDKNVEYLKHMEKGWNENEKARLTSNDLQGMTLESQHLLASVLAAFHAKPALSKMKIEKKVSILVGLKTLIESLAAVTLR